MQTLNPRNKTRLIHIGSVPVGGGSPVSVQSMTNTPTADPERTLAQIKPLAAAGCQIIRCAVPDMKSADAIADIVKDSPIPVIADIHFDYRLALAAIQSGVHGIRLNPGNIGSADRVRKVVEAAGTAGIPIRVGANTGSLPDGMFESKLHAGYTHDEALAESLCEAVQSQISILEDCGFHDIKVSLKASSVPVTVKAFRRFSQISDYPLHLGVTEAGSVWRGIHKSAAGIGSLLLDGIGDTIRVSLSADPVEEVRSAITLLEAVGLRDANPDIVACPTCARTAYNMFEMLDKVEKLIRTLKESNRIRPVRKVAVMGCIVNGPGEAKDADFGLAGAGGGKVMLFRHGEKIAILPEAEAFAALEKELTMN